MALRVDALVVNPSEWDSVLLEPGNLLLKSSEDTPACVCARVAAFWRRFLKPRVLADSRRFVGLSAEDSVGCVCCSRPTFAVPVQEVNSPGR